MNAFSLVFIFNISSEATSQICGASLEVRVDELPFKISHHRLHAEQQTRQCRLVFVQYECVCVTSHSAYLELEAQRSRCYYHASSDSNKSAAFSVGRLVVLVCFEQRIRFEGAIFRRVIDRKLRARI